MSRRLPPTDPGQHRRDLHYQIEWFILPGTLPSCFLGELGKLIGSRKVDWEQSVPSEGTPYWRPVGPVGGNPDRDSWLLEWRRLESSIPVSGEPFEPTIQETGTCAGIHFVSKGLEVVDVPQSDTHRQASTAQAVEGDGFPRHLLDPSSREGSDHGSQANRLRGDCHCAEHHPDIGDRAISRWIVDAVPEEHGIPAPSFGEGCEVCHHVRLG